MTVLGPLCSPAAITFRLTTIVSHVTIANDFVAGADSYNAVMTMTPSRNQRAACG